MGDKEKLFRAITDVEVVESVNAEDTVLIEQDGVAKRAPKGSIGAQSDWNVNDETNPAYVKNRTHWTEKVVDIQWDGNPEGHVTVDMSSMAPGALLIHVSDEVLTVEDLVGSTVTISNIAEQVDDTIILTESNCQTSPGGVISILSEICPVGIISPADEHTEEGTPITFPKKGVYLFYTPDELAVRSITKETIHQIDPKFIPGGSANPLFFGPGASGLVDKTTSERPTAKAFLDAYFAGAAYYCHSSNGVELYERIIGFAISGDYLQPCYKNSEVLYEHSKICTTAEYNAYMAELI